MNKSQVKYKYYFYINYLFNWSQLVSILCHHQEKSFCRRISLNSSYAIREATKNALVTVYLFVEWKLFSVICLHLTVLYICFQDTRLMSSLLGRGRYMLSLGLAVSVCLYVCLYIYIYIYIRVGWFFTFLIIIIINLTYRKLCLDLLSTRTKN